MIVGRRATCWILIGILASCVESLAATAAEKYKLEEPVDDSRIFGVGTRVDVTGKTQPSPKVEPLTLTAAATISYRERRLLGPGSNTESFRSVREYDTTQSNIDAGGEKSSSRLSEHLKVIVAQGRIEGVELYSLGGALTSNELDLIRTPADSLALIALLPAKEVEIGETWNVPEWAVQMITSLDAISKGTMTCQLVSIKKQVAHIKLAATVQGASLSAVSDVTINGFFEYDLQSRCINQGDFTQFEKRGFGPVSPAFEFTARIRLLRKPASLPGLLVEQQILELANTEPKANATVLRFDSPWNIGLEYPRHWHLWKIQDKSAVFRLLDQGNFIAQCDLAPIAPAKAGEHLSEQQFEQDIRQALGDRLKELDRGQVIPTANRHFVYRISGSGADGERKLTWIFYLMADPSGRQASLSITADTPLIETLANRERDLIDSLRFGPAPPSPALRTTER